MGVSVVLPVDGVWNGGSPSWRGDISFGAPPNYCSFRAAKMTPFWDPNFTPPCGQLAAPYLFAHGEPGPRSKLYTQMEASGSASDPVSHWPCPGRVSHAWE